MNDKENLKLYSKSAAAAALGIGKAKLNLLIEEGKIGFIPIKNRIFISHSEIMRFITDSTQRNPQNASPCNIYDFIDFKISASPKRKKFNSNELFEQLIKEAA